MKKILVAGPTGNLGPHLVKAFVNAGHDVSVLIRPQSFGDPEKRSKLPEAINYIQGDVDDRGSLQGACEGQDVVVSALGGGQLLQQVAFAEAAVNAGVERFVPSEFGVDPFILERGTCDLVDVKANVQEKIKATGIPTTMIYANAFMEFWATGLGQLGPMSPPESVQFYGDGNTAVYMAALQDIAKYTSAIIEDDDTINREVSIKAHKTTQNQLIENWEQLSGNQVERIPVSGQDLLDVINKSTAPEDMMTRIFTQLHRSVWIIGDGAKSRDGVIEATTRYPQMNPISISQYLSHFNTVSA